MSLAALSVLAALYLGGLVYFRKSRFGLPGYVWGAFGFSALGILFAQAGGWHAALGRVEAQNMVGLFGWTGLAVGGSDQASLIVPDPTGWSVLNIGVECSALIESLIFTGLLVFYPRFSVGQRLARLAAGLSATYAINLVRMAVIVAMIHWLGKGAAPLAHAVVARLIFFVGIVAVYWQLLTLPTLAVVRRELEVSGRAAL